MIDITRTRPIFPLYILAFIFLLISQSLFSQSKIKGNKEVITEQTNVEAFHSLSIGNDLEVELIKSMIPSVTIKADENLHPVIKYQVIDSVLSFQVTKIVKGAKEFKAVIRYTEPLRTIILNGNVDVEAEKNIALKKLDLIMHDNARIKANITADRFRLENNNESSFNLTTNCILSVESETADLELKNNSNNILDINTEELNIKTVDKSELTIEGFTYKLNVESSNSSEIKGDKLLTNITKLKLSDKADASVQVSDTISINASGSSKVLLYGEPKILVKNLSETASIIKKEL